METDQPDRMLHFGDFVLDAENLNLYRKTESAPVNISMRLLELLSLLASNPGKLLSRQEIFDTVWAGRVVTDNSLNQAVSALRSILGDNPESPVYIRTFPRRGLKFISPVTQRDSRSIPADTGAARYKPSAFSFLPTVAGRFRTALAITAFLLVSLLFYASSRKPVDMPVHILAVIPALDSSLTKTEQNFSLALTDNILDALAQVDALSVISGSSSFPMTNTSLSPREIGIELNATSVLRLGITRTNEKLQFTTELTDVESGHMRWIDVIEDDPANLIDARRELSEKITGALTIELNVEDRAQLAGTGTDDLRAYEAFLTGSFLERYEGKGKLGQELYRDALEYDPEYAEAWAALALSTAAESWRLDDSGDIIAMQELALDYGRKALELDPELPFANAQFSQISVARQNWHDAKTHIEKAITATSDYRTREAYSAFLFRTGYLAEARDQSLILKRLDPRVSYWNQFLLYLYIGNHQYQEAHELEAIIKRSGYVTVPDHTSLLTAVTENNEEKIREVMASGTLSDPELWERLAQAENLPEAISRLQQNRKSGEVTTSLVSLTPLAMLAAHYGDHELALELAGEDIRNSSLRLVFIWMPVFSEMRKLPGFSQLMTDIGLHDLWQSTGQWPDLCRPTQNKEFSCF